MERKLRVLSIAVLATVYGVIAVHTGWFPSPLIERALRQTDRLLSPPEYTAPRVYDGQGVRTAHPDRMQPGLTLVAAAWKMDGEWSRGFQLIDAQGGVLHQWKVPVDRLFDDPPDTGGLPSRVIHGVHLFQNGDLMFNLDYVGTALLDACGRVQWSKLTGGHHAITPADDSTFWVPAVENRSQAAADSFPGIDGPIFPNIVLRITRSGSVLDRLSALDLLYRNDLERYVAKGIAVRREDVTHLNDADPLPDALANDYPLFDDGDLLLSLLHLDLVVVVDPDTRRVKWHASDPFIRQHDPDWMGDGWIGVFDNRRDYTDRGTMLGGSRVVAIQPHTDSTRILFPTDRSAPFYTRTMGAWQQLANGNLLLTESRTGRVIEVTSGGETVWDWVIPPYSEDRVPEVPEAIRYDLTPEEVERWTCTS